jgi:NTP pyrophosphatase (non-canonical NTP hydrolase)
MSDGDAQMCYAMDDLNNCDGPRQQLKTLEEMQAETRANNEAHGWYEDERPFGDDASLLHSEVSEMYEAYRDWGVDDATKGRHAHPGYAGPCPTAKCPLPKPEGVGSEVADVLIRLLDTCERHGINLRAEYERKLAYNRTREYRHGGKAV